MQNPDQVLTQDVDKLCDSLVELYSNLSKVLIVGGGWGLVGVAALGYMECVCIA